MSLLATFRAALATKTRTQVILVLCILQLSALLALAALWACGRWNKYQIERTPA